MRKSLWILIMSASLVVFIIAAWIVRKHTCIERKRIEIIETHIPEEKILEISNMMEGRILDIPTLVERVKDARVLLIGETHLQNEVIAYFLDILNHLPDEQLVLNLELPSSIQGNIDAYLEIGEDHLLDTLKATRGCLPYQEILRWCYRNPERVVRVNAIDETLARSQFNRRHLCTDTRNQTMKRHIYRAYRDFPDARIIAYGDQLHFMKSGRYKFDIKNRTPAGRRLLDSDIPEEDIRVVMIAGEGEFPLSTAWRGSIGAMETNGELGQLPFTYFYEYPIYRVDYAQELFDFFVNVGETTEIER